jgi:hypothetical protein
MGMGPLGGQDIVFKRKYRWTFEVTPSCGGRTIPAHFVKLASRPNLSIEETEINYLNAKMWIPGKGTWETITVTYYDLGGSSASNSMADLFAWLSSVYDFQTTGNPRQSSRRGGAGSGGGYGAEAVLALYDGCGTAMEQWNFEHMWPQAVNFGELDFYSSEEVTIELTLRFSECTFTNLCPGRPFVPCCEGC